VPWSACDSRDKTRHAASSATAHGH
jgi:hypothetical protein